MSLFNQRLDSAASTSYHGLYSAGVRSLLITVGTDAVVFFTDYFGVASVEHTGEAKPNRSTDSEVGWWL